MKLYLHMRENGVTALGPGTRFGVWVAGCNRNCPGWSAAHPMLLARARWTALLAITVT